MVLDPGPDINPNSPTSCDLGAGLLGPGGTSDSACPQPPRPCGFRTVDLLQAHRNGQFPVLQSHFI